MWREVEGCQRGKDVEFAKKKIVNLPEQPEETDKIIYSGYHKFLLMSPTDILQIVVF